MVDLGRPTGHEVMVAAAILEASGDPRSGLLLEQFRRARGVKRRFEGPLLRVRVPWTVVELMVELDEDVVSDPVQVRDLRSGQLLRFRVHLARGGFFRQLEGQADRRWPRRWMVDAHELKNAATGALRLPPELGPDALAGWLGIPVPTSADVIVHRPAAASSVAALERREGVPVPGEVRALLDVTDGVVAGNWAFLGVRDLHTVDLEGRTYWQVAVGTGPDDDHRCLHSGDGLMVVPTQDAQPYDMRNLEVSLRDWLASLLTRHTDGP